LMESTFGSMRTSVLALIAFFVLGFIALFFIPAKEEPGVFNAPEKEPLLEGHDEKTLEA
jgi:MFS-type transporter involved in bile tolerance (Atg22 family)